MKHRVEVPAARNFFAMCVPILIIVAALAHLLFGGNFEPSSALAAPPRVIHVRHAPGYHAVRNVDRDDCDRLDSGAGSFDPGPGWPYTAAWN